MSNEWIKNTQKIQPFENGMVKVDIRTRFSHDVEWYHTRLGVHCGALDWSMSNTEGDILWYRVHVPEETV